MPITIKPSTNKDKKFMAIIDYPNIKRTIHFGAKGMSDFTKNKDPERKANYISRHEPRENWRDPLTAGFWSRWVLWNKTSLEQSKMDAIRKAKQLLKV